MQHISKPINRIEETLLKVMMTYNRDMSSFANSPDIRERQEYSEVLKELISMTEKTNKQYGDSPGRKMVLQNLKTRLSEYDIYNQQVPYVCGTCGEKECVCQFADIRKIEAPIVEELSPEITQEQLNKLF